MSIEEDCIVQVNGKEFTAMGAVVTSDRITAYPAEGGVLNDFKGKPLGTWKAVSTWKTPKSFTSDTMSQIEVVVNGVTYTGRGAGVGMVFNGRRKKR